MLKYSTYLQQARLVILDFNDALVKLGSLISIDDQEILDKLPNMQEAIRIGQQIIDRSYGYLDLRIYFKNLQKEYMLNKALNSQESESKSEQESIK